MPMLFAQIFRFQCHFGSEKKYCIFAAYQFYSFFSITDSIERDGSRDYGPRHRAQKLK